MTVVPQEVEKWQKEASLYETQWNALLSSISASSTVEQFKISTSLSVDDAVMTAVQHMEGTCTVHTCIMYMYMCGQWGFIYSFIVNTFSSLSLSDIFTFTPTDISGQDEEDDGDDDPVLHEGTCTCTLIYTLNHTVHVQFSLINLRYTMYIIMHFSKYSFCHLHMHIHVHVRVH